MCEDKSRFINADDFIKFEIQRDRSDYNEVTIFFYASTPLNRELIVKGIADPNEYLVFEMFRLSIPENPLFFTHPEFEKNLAWFIKHGIKECEIRRFLGEVAKSNKPSWDVVFVP